MSAALTSPTDPALHYISEMRWVEGWLSELDAQMFREVFAQQATEGVTGDALEIGVWRGKSAILIALLLNEGERLFAADLFDLRPAKHPFFNDPAIFRENATRFACLDRMHEVRLDSLQEGHKLASEIAGKTIRFIHIDGGHSYDVVKADIELALRVIAPGGLLVLDDFFNRKHPGVTQAAMELLLMNRRFTAFAMTGKKLWICEASAHDRYFERIKSSDAVKSLAPAYTDSLFEAKLLSMQK